MLTATNLAPVCGDVKNETDGFMLGFYKFYEFKLDTKINYGTSFKMWFYGLMWFLFQLWSSKAGFPNFYTFQTVFTFDRPVDLV